jgi:hypothetical protein
LTKPYHPTKKNSHKIFIIFAPLTAPKKNPSFIISASIGMKRKKKVLKERQGYQLKFCEKLKSGKN